MRTNSTLQNAALLTAFAMLVLGPVVVHAQGESSSRVRVGILPSAPGGLASQAGPHQDGREDWGKAMAKKLAGFLPEPVPGLINHLPWQRPNELRLEGDASDGFGFGEGVGLYPEPKAIMAWTFDDPDLVKRVEAITSEEDALVARAKDPKADMSPLQPLGKKADSLRRSSRRLMLTLRANDSLRRELKPAGTLEGCPLYRQEISDGVQLAVFVGPVAFKNPAVKEESLQVNQLKTVLIEATLNSTPEAAKADEALTRQMLEKIDYEGLKKLLQP